MEDKKDTMNYDELVMNIKLKKWQIVDLLEALRMGIWVEGWNSALTHSAMQEYDKYSDRWICRVGFIIDEIRKQTGATEDYATCSHYYQSAEAINKFVSEQCAENEKAYWEEERKKYKFEIQTNYDPGKRPCAVCAWGFEPRVGKMLFNEGTRDPVCDGCSKKLAPELFEEVEKIAFSQIPF